MHRRGPASLLSGIVGVVLAHVAAYVVAFPDQAHRADELHATGHGYWHHAVAFAGAAGLGALALAASSGVRRASRERTGRASFGAGLAELSLWQLALFGGMESIERVAVGASPTSLLHEPAFLVGLVLQIATAAAVLILLNGVERAAEAVVLRRCYPALVAARPALWGVARRAGLPLWVGPAEPRGPPPSGLLV